MFPTLEQDLADIDDEEEYNMNPMINASPSPEPIVNSCAATP